jgi:hypothetical protein
MSDPLKVITHPFGENQVHYPERIRVFTGTEDVLSSLAGVTPGSVTAITLTK